jgi:toxin-antitoxin system PIN domain toxin
VSTHLLDGNVLVALTDAAHVHHGPAVDWFRATNVAFATCPVTQGTLLRMLLRHGAVASPAEAADVLDALCAHPRHRFWPDDVDYRDLAWRGIGGHRQITDAYLAALARRHRGRLATLDRGLAGLHADVAELIADASSAAR